MKKSLPWRKNHHDSDLLRLGHIQTLCLVLYFIDLYHFGPSTSEADVAPLSSVLKLPG